MKWRTQKVKNYRCCCCYCCCSHSLTVVVVVIAAADYADCTHTMGPLFLCDRAKGGNLNSGTRQDRTRQGTVLFDKTTTTTSSQPSTSLLSIPFLLLSLHFSFIFTFSFFFPHLSLSIFCYFYFSFLKTTEYILFLPNKNESI